MPRVVCLVSAWAFAKYVAQITCGDVVEADLRKKLEKFLWSRYKGFCCGFQDFSILARIRTSSFKICQLSACPDTFSLIIKCRFCSCRTSFAFWLCTVSSEVCMFVVLRPALMVHILSSWHLLRQHLCLLSDASSQGAVFHIAMPCLTAHCRSLRCLLWSCLAFHINALSYSASSVFVMYHQWAHCLAQRCFECAPFVDASSEDATFVTQMPPLRVPWLSLRRLSAGVSYVIAVCPLRLIRLTLCFLLWGRLVCCCYASSDSASFVFLLLLWQHLFYHTDASSEGALFDVVMPCLRALCLSLCCLLSERLNFPSDVSVASSVD